MARKTRGAAPDARPKGADPKGAGREGAQGLLDGSIGESAGLLRTAEVLERTGITHQILYRYITLGLIEPALVKESGFRLFHPDVVPLIETIKNLNRRYSLRDIKEIYFRDERVRRHTERTRGPG